MEREELLARLADLRARARAAADLVVRQHAIVDELGSRERGLLAERQAFDATGVAGAARSGTAVLLLAAAVYALLIAAFTHDVAAPVVLACAGYVTLKKDPKRTVVGKIALAVGIMFVASVAFSVVRAVLTTNVFVAFLVLAMLAVAVAAARQAYRAYLRRDARQVEAANVVIRLANDNEIAYTQALRAEYDQLVGSLGRAQQDLAARTAGWFPPDYLSLEAIEFFASAVENYRADTMKEAVNQFVQHGYHVEQVEKLDSIRRQVVVGNLLKVASIGLQAQAMSEARASADRLVAAQRDTASAVRSQARATQDHAKAARAASARLRDIRNRL